jgi:hypothetical protein
VWRNSEPWTIHSTQISDLPPVLDAELIAQTILLAPSPNPARSRIVFRFSLASRQQARLTVFDLMGRRLAQLVDGLMDAGPHTFVWNRSDAHGRAVADGVYFLRFDADGKRMTRRFVLVQ